MAEISPMRNFDPRRVGSLECRAWECYYRRKWAPFLVASVSLVRAGFGMSWLRTVRGAWLVLRANQLWAPYPDNDPAGAEGCMRRFYTLVATAHGEVLDAAEAARRDVEWWRVHRHVQRDGTADVDALTAALVDLYVFVYGAEPDAVRPAARLRADAMVVSDEWVVAGADPNDARLTEERALLVRSFAALLAAVHSPSGAATSMAS